MIWYSLIRYQETRKGSSKGNLIKHSSAGPRRWAITVMCIEATEQYIRILSLYSSLSSVHIRYQHKGIIMISTPSFSHVSTNLADEQIYRCRTDIARYVRSLSVECTCGAPCFFFVIVFEWERLELEVVRRLPKSGFWCQSRTSPVSFLFVIFSFHLSWPETSSKYLEDHRY
jgi:hypothetical protein